jgi:transposase
MQITTIGLDLAKSWFQVHGVDDDRKVIIRRKLKRGEVFSFFKPSTPSRPQKIP